MPRKKKLPASTTPKPATKKVNKTAWILSQPAAMAAKDVVAKAGAAGIKLTTGQVYTARSTAKTRKAKSTAGKPTQSKASVTTRSPAKSFALGGDDEMAFRRLVLSIGLPKAEAYLSELKRSVGL